MPKVTKEQRIAKIEKVHPGKFTYQDIEDFTTKDKKYTVTCPVHGNFRKTMSNLVSNRSGCPTCGNSAKGKHNKKDTKSFISEANKIHNNFYSYENTNYKDSHTEVQVTCPVHGTFSVKPYVHLSGHKCRKCAYEDNSIAKRMSISGKPTSLYYIKFSEVNIWKIGCSVNIPHRFHNIQYDVLFSKEYEDSRVAYFVEAWILKSTASDVYKGLEFPIEKGRTELRSAPVSIEQLVLEAEQNCSLYSL